MNIKPASVHQRRYELIRLIQAGLKNGGANTVPEASKRKMKRIEKNEVRFLAVRTIWLMKSSRASLIGRFTNLVEKKGDCLQIRKEVLQNEREIQAGIHLQYFLGSIGSNGVFRL
jgi:hypothetical protein